MNRIERTAGAIDKGFSQDSFLLGLRHRTEVPPASYSLDNEFHICPGRNARNYSVDRILTRALRAPSQLNTSSCRG